MIKPDMQMFQFQPRVYKEGNLAYTAPLVTMIYSYYRSMHEHKEASQLTDEYMKAFIHQVK